MSQAAANSLVTEGTELLLGERFADALVRFEKATRLYPPHAQAWRGLGHALLRLGRAPEAARAFDQAIGHAPRSATALWAGAVAHAELGNRVVAQRYLARTLALEPSWLALARDVPALAPLLRPSMRAADALAAALGPFAAVAFHHAVDEETRVEVGRIVDQPAFGRCTFVTVGLADHAWDDGARPRVELVLASTIDDPVCGQILANLALHLRTTDFFPAPGVMVRDVVGALGAGELSRRLPHVFITEPRGWRGLPLPLVDGPPPITAAQVVPVSEAEYRRWHAAPAALEAAVVAPGFDPGDLRRAGG